MSCHREVRPTKGEMVRTHTSYSKITTCCGSRDCPGYKLMLRAIWDFGVIPHKKGVDLVLPKNTTIRFLDESSLDIFSKALIVCENNCRDASKDKDDLQWLTGTGRYGQ